MIQLENINKVNNLISANVKIIDGTDREFEIVVNIETEDIIKNTLNKMNSYVAHARYKLLELAEESNIPKTAEVVWF